MWEKGEMSDTEKEIIERMSYCGGQWIWNWDEVRDDTGMDWWGGGCVHF